MYQMIQKPHLRSRLAGVRQGCLRPSAQKISKRRPARFEMNVSHKHLVAFVSLARHGSFTRASAALGISQPTLTAVIKQLEAASGVQLFDRTTRRVLLTQAGEAFRPSAEAAVASLDRALAVLRGLASGRRGCVRVASVPSFVVRVLPRVLKEFEQAYPGVTVHIREENETVVNRRMQDGEADFGFGSDFETIPDLTYQSLVQDQVGLLCRADHPLARGRGPLAWKDLKGLRFAAFGPQTTLRRLVNRISDLPLEVIEPVYEVADVITLEALLEAGLAVAAAFKLGTYRGRDRKLVFRPLIEPALTRTICLITHSERALSPAASALIESTIHHLRRRTDGFRLQGTAARRSVSASQRQTTEHG
jgi:LysR family carnitine catabolism transcriptional activator